MLRAFPDLLDEIGCAAGRRLRADSCSRRCGEVAPAGRAIPQVVLLSPGIYNSAYFEHVFLAREMGVPLVEGRDLVVENDRVYMRTIGGLAPVDVIYRRINDDFLDPEAFHPDSMLGVPGLMRAYRAGNVALANAVGTGVADDKAVYAYMPRIIRYYLERGADPAECRDAYLPRAGRAALHARPSRPSWWSSRSANPGGYGITIGPRASRAELGDCRDQAARRSGQLYQPALHRPVGRADPGRRRGASRATSICGPSRSPAASTWVLARRADAGGAARRGSLVVNSSQGGGSKDTWVLE